MGRNEGERLKRCLRSIPEHLAAVYVDSELTDGSVQYAQGGGVEVVQLDLTIPFTAARASNAGLHRLLEQASNLAFVHFVGGDCELEPPWLSEAINFLDCNVTAAAVCARRRERYPGASFYNKICDREWGTPIGEAEACGGAALFRLSALRQCGFVDPSLIAGEEPELCYRLREGGWRIWCIDQEMTIHNADLLHFSQWWKRAVPSGLGYAQVWHKAAKFPSLGLYLREIFRVFAWTLGLPILGVLLAIFFGPIYLLSVPALWLLQFARLAWRNGLAVSFHPLIGKAAECTGALRYLLGYVMLRPLKAICCK
ncbi:glycosyltransferase family 2 protein [Erythrobacter sp. QSSC1-22B]|uniref:glycosyltransferase n=1 Tax=Erythrobacter sp. QSSC1-22B TaxID=1860125 RepID=UPI0021018DAA|nr:glycosyltransferase family 2 protein [Erythrobacter sp. QSSC1-22B]